MDLDALSGGANAARGARDRGGSLSAERAISVARQVAGGLVALHAEGIVHRDLKPSNVFLCDDGRVIILDFGIVLFLDYTSLTERGAFIGTYGYAAPEQLEGEEVPATDLYSLGAVLYHVITGRLPFRARGHLELLTGSASRTRSLPRRLPRRFQSRLRS